MLVRVDLEPRPFQDGRAFGEVGAYRELRGEAVFGLDPDDPRNALVTDLNLAPRDASGHVPFVADLRLIQPVAPERGNRGLFLDVVNRGQSVFERMIEPGPMGPDTHVTEGFLLQRGYTIVSCGWQHDVPRGGGRFGVAPPPVLRDTDQQPVRGRVSTARPVDAPTQFIGPFDGSPVERAYPAADVDEPDATLTVRDDPSGPPTHIPRAAWRFARLEDGNVVPDPHHVYFPAGFQPGKTYELSYTGTNATLTGAGLATTRDLLSFLRFGSAEQGNPCADQLDFALAIGGSQTGRFLRQFLYQGFCEDESGRLVLDGIFAIAAGARMTEANWRFGQPSSQGPKSAVFPFTDGVQIDPVSGEADGLGRLGAERDRRPKVIHMNTSSEYCCSAAVTHVSAAVSHLTADGTADADVPDNVRIYHCAGTQHAPSPLPLGAASVPTGAYFANTLDYKPFVRAAVDNLHAWVTRGVEPPPSCYPRLDNGTLVERDVVRAAMPRLPGPPLPKRVHHAHRAGADGFDAQATGQAAPDLLPAVDADGNELAGLRHPDLTVPLATYTAWNPRSPEQGGDQLLVRATGATIPFARTATERAARGDPRPSIAERYPSRAEFLTAVRGAAVTLAEQRYVLAGDVEALVDDSAQRFVEFSQLESPLP